MSDNIDYTFLSEGELKQIEQEHPVVLWGAGVLGEMTLNILHEDPLCFVDNNLKLQGETFEGISVQSPEALLDLRSKEDIFLVICIQKFKELHPFLDEHGFEYGADCALTPMAREYKVLEDLRGHEAMVLFSNYDEEGGLYLFDFQEEPEKVFHGSIRGFTHVNDEIICASKRGIHRLDDKDFTEIEHGEIDEYDIYGITYDENADQLILGNTQSDEVSFLDYESLDLVESIPLSDRFDNTGEEQHHINDIVVVGERIFVLVFSLSGWWRWGVFDGGVYMIHRRTKEMEHLAISDVWMPHSLKEHGGDLYVLDSMNGDLLKGLKHKQASFQGFVRGLAFNGKFCYVGQSLHRHISRMDEQLTTQINPGIHIIDRDNNASRFVPLPEQENIYNIEHVDWL